MSKKTNSKLQVMESSYYRTYNYLDMVKAGLITRSALMETVINCVGGRGQLRYAIFDGLSDHLDTFKKQLVSIGNELIQLDDDGRAFRVVSSTVSQVTGGKDYEKLGRKQLNLSYKDDVVSIKLAVKRAPKTQSKVLSKAMKATATQIITGRNHGAMVDMMAKFLAYAEVDADTLREIADMVEVGLE